MTIKDYNGPERRHANRDMASRAGLWLIRRGPILGVAVLLIYVSLAVLTFGIVESNRRAKDQLARLEQLIEAQNDAAAFTTKATNCILEQLTEHRHKTHFHNHQAAQAHGYEPPALASPPPVPEHLKMACDPFLDLPPPGPNGDKAPPPPGVGGDRAPRDEENR